MPIPAIIGIASDHMDFEGLSKNDWSLECLLFSWLIGPKLREYCLVGLVNYLTIIKNISIV